MVLNAAQLGVALRSTTHGVREDVHEQGIL
jgi:hypothetical protein